MTLAVAKKLRRETKGDWEQCVAAPHGIHPSPQSYPENCPFPFNDHTHTHNRFTALLKYARDHPAEQVPER